MIMIEHKQKLKRKDFGWLIACFGVASLLLGCVVSNGKSASEDDIDSDSGNVDDGASGSDGDSHSDGDSDSDSDGDIDGGSEDDDSESVGDNEGDDTDTGSSLPSFDWAVDMSIVPFAETMDPLSEEGKPRPLGAVGGSGIPNATFVENELVVFSNDLDAVKEFAKEISGEVALTVNPEESGVTGPPMHLIVVEEPIADMARFGADLATFAVMDDGEHGDGATEDDGEHGDGAVEDDGEHGLPKPLFSSLRGANLMALAARTQLSSGLNVAVNWVSEPFAIPNATEEAPNDSGGYYDAYDFPWFAMDTGMKTGVTEAWNLLHHSEELNNRVKVAVLDSGFSATDDFQNVSAATAWPGFGPLNRENHVNCSDGSACPWHGTDVAGAAMGIPDNRFGSAGTGGPVADPVMIYTTYDYLASITAVYLARSKGAKVVNMSYGTPVPWWLKWTTAGFRSATDHVRDSGVLLFAAAGNSGKNVDSEVCAFEYCWEKTFYTPCENPGVTCVGGLSGAGALDSSSNFGDESVDLYAPWCVFVGPNPKEDAYHRVCGTSVSSPFVAGAAALVWAAAPSLSGADVNRILSETADGYMNRKVNVYKAVLTAIGLLTELHITDPAPGSERIQGVDHLLTGDITFVSSPGSDIEVVFSWHSSLEGDIGTETVVVSRDEGAVHIGRTLLDYRLMEGTHQITLTATFNWPGDIIGLLSPMVVQKTTSVVVVNPAPSVTIESPDADASLCSGEPIVFRAVGTDVNQTLTDEAYGWISAMDTSPLPTLYDLGTGALMTTDLLPAGTHRVTVTVTDDGGATGSDYIDIELLPVDSPLCTNRSPQAAISYPTEGLVIREIHHDDNGEYADIDFTAQVSDYEDDDASLTIEWIVDDLGVVATGAETTARVYMTETCSSSHVLTLRVTDSDGNVTEDVVEFGMFIVC
jgi:serine protease